MARYYYHLTNYHHRHRHIKRLKRLIAGACLLTILIAGLIIGDVLRLRRKPAPPPTQQSTIIQQSPVSIFRTEYFQFQTGSKWAAIATDGNNGMYVYRNLDQSFIQQELDVYVNKTPNELTATYIVPVAAAVDGRLTARALSPHCKNALPADAKKTATPVTYLKVTFTCITDGTDFRVLAGIENGTPNMKLIRPNGASANYILYFHDVTANPSAEQFEQILNSFQTR